MDSIDEIKKVETSKKIKFMNAMGTTYNVSKKVGNASCIAIGTTYNVSKKVGNASMQFSKNHPYIAGATITAGAVMATPLLLASIGFTTGGIAAGSIASSAMASLGSGSVIIGTCQAVGATGTVLVSGISAATTAVGAAVGTYTIGKTIEAVSTPTQLAITVPPSKL